MTEEDPLKKIENEIKQAENKVGGEIEAENARLKKEIEDLKREQARIKQLRSENKKLEQMNPAKKEKITEVEVQINLDSFNKTLGILYNIFIKKRVLFYILLILAVIIGIVIRSASLPALGASPLIGNNYLNAGGSLTGLDPYIFYINTNSIIATGNVPVVQHLEYLPLGLVSRSDPLIISFFDAYIFRLMQPFVPGATSMTWAMLYPVIAAAFATILLFLICLEIFNSYSIASLSAFVFPVFQTLLNRTTAGFSTKDAMGFLFILLTIYFLAKAIRSKDTRSKVLYGFLIMFATGLTAATSGFSKFVEFIVPIVYIIMILLDYAKRGDLYSFLPFGFFLGIWASIVTTGGPLTTYLLDSIQFYPMYLCYIMVLFKLFVYDKYKQKLKIPFINAGVSVGIYSTIIIVALLGVIGKLSHVISYVVNNIQYPLGLGVVNPVSLTIAEYGQVTLANKICDASGLLGSCGSADAISVNFLLLMAGGIFLTYYVLKRFKHWYIPFLATLPFILFLVGGIYTPGNGATSVLLVFVFGAFIPIVYWFLHRKEPEMNRALSKMLIMTMISIILSVSFFLSMQTANYYKYGMFGVAIIFILTFALDKVNEQESNKIAYIIMLVFFLLAMLFANLQNQLLEGEGFVGVIVVAFAAVIIPIVLVKYVNKTFKSSKSLVWMLSGIIIVVFLLFLAFDLNSSLQLSYNEAQGSGSGLALWGPTMLWINQNTPVNSSLISWWDYGYWEEAIANRTTVADGSNSYGYQSMIAKYFFEATSPYQYSTYLNFIHNPTYAVISGSEVEKFSAISTIALNYTQYTPMTETQEAYNQGTVPGGYQYLAVFGGSSGGIAPLEANMVISGVPWNSSITLLVQVVIPFNSTNSTFSQGPAYGELYNELTQQVSNLLPMKQICVYGQGCKNQTNNASAIPGAVMILNATNTVNLHIGGYQNYPGGYQVAQLPMDSYGNAPAVLFLPQKSLGNLFAKLYLLNETVPGFSLIFSDGLPVDSLLSINNQVLTNINVYKINYTALAAYNLLSAKCSIDTSAVNYCDNLSYLPSVFNASSSLISGTRIP
jgi:asparagine N-glycosylation enzyme membrane subunit Stt3